MALTPYKELNLAETKIHNMPSQIVAELLHFSVLSR